MEQLINNIKTYNEKLYNGMFDKIWFLDKIENNITTIVDFGCADGTLGNIINSIFPEKFRCIGIDSNADMRKLATDNGIEVYKSLKDLPDIDYNNTVLILNSVIHEIFTYAPFLSAYELFQSISDLKFKQIAIRDMCLNDLDTLPNYTKEIMDSKFATKYNDFIENNPAKIYTDVADYRVSALEFLLKYQYEDNWEREKTEVYLWQWHKIIYDIFSDYSIDFDSTFRIPYQVKQIRKNFNIQLNYNTHRKMLLTL